MKTRRARKPSRKTPWLPLGAAGAAPKVAEAVFSLPGAVRARSLCTALALTMMGAAGLGAAMAATPLAPRAPAARTQARPLTVELFEPPPPPPPPPDPPSPPAEAPPPRVRARRVVSNPAEAPAPAPAQAAQIVAQEASEPEVLDLSTFTIASGSAARAVGGASSGSGTGTQPVMGKADPNGVAGGSGAGTQNLSQPVRLPANEWDCPWPAEADALGIIEQAVMLQVVVKRDGGVESAQLKADPGSGFGEAALACARRSRFEPARDVNGSPVRARSGPIRVLFIR